MKGKLFGIMCILLTVMCVYAAAEDACLSGNEDHEKGITSFITGDYDSAMEHWLKAAQSGDNGALFDIGWMLWFDQDILDNQEQYTYWSEKAKEAGYYDFDEENVHIAYELGLFNHFDIPDINDAVYWYRRAALGGNVLSMRFLAEIFHDHESALYDIEEAAHWYQQAAEAGDVEAMYSIGKMFRSGEGVPQDEQQAVYWLMKAAETDYEEGLSYYNTKYYSPVMRYWERAAEAGHVNAMYMLGQMYGLGLSSMDFDQAIYWCQKAAEVGHSDARYMVEQMYDFYKSKNPDIDQAIFWCQKAAEVGHLNAMYSLAEMYRHGYYNGIIVQENPQLAVYWYQRAGEAGCVDAMYEIAEMYYDGEGIGQNIEQAAYWFQRGAEAGHVESMVWLGTLYYSGEGIEQNIEQAAYWFQRGAEAGHEESMVWLGILYYNGEGVEQDNEKALMWLTLAAENGYWSAYDLVDEYFSEQKE